MLLNCIGMLYGSDENAKRLALCSFSELVSITEVDKILRPSNEIFLCPADLSVEKRWVNWIEDEARRRTGYCTWVCGTISISVE